MSPRQWFSLLAFYIAYLFFGASVFYHEEQKLETVRRAVAKAKRIEMNALMVKYLAPDNIQLQDELLDTVSDYCGKPVTHPSKDEYIPPYIWTFYHSFFFSFIVCSTVGYGNISPNNTFGRMFMIAYALIGIPVNGFLFAYLGEFFAKVFIKLHKRYKEYKLSTNRNWVPLKISLIGRIILYLIPGIVVFIFLPAILFTYFEGWDYTISIYYSFVTLTTIGFGDFVPTFQPHQERTFGIYFVFYQLFILCWFILGVGYLVMIIGFLTKGLRSKRIKRIEHNLAINIKETHRRIWNGVTKDVGYIRKILNEVYFLKFKPVYKDHDETMRKFQIPKSKSCPDLFAEEDEDVDDEYETRIIPTITHRARAFSECPRPTLHVMKQHKKSVMGSMTFNRVQSDSELSHIDKEKTFAPEAVRAAVEPSELLAKVVVALGGYRLPMREEEQQSIHSSALGIHGFTDSQILASEQNYNSNWSLGISEKSYASLPPPQQFYRRDRPRAISEIRIPIEESVKASTEWTWSGANTQIGEIERMRSKAAKPKENLYKSSLQTKLRYGSETTVDFPRDDVPSTKSTASAASKSLLYKLNPFKRKIPQQMKRHSIAPGQDLDPQNYFRKTQNGRASAGSLSKNYLMNQHRRQSVFIVPCVEEENDLLEHTTIADLIRAIEMVHTDNNPIDSIMNVDDAEEMLRISKKQRKLGTDHLTPPRNPSTQTLYNFQRNKSVHTIHGPLSDIGPVGHSARRSRLYSCTTGTPMTQNVGDRVGILGDSNPFFRAAPPYITTHEPTATLKRRFSVRPSNLDKAPGQFHKPTNLPVVAPSQQLQQQLPRSQQTSTNSLASAGTMPLQRKLSWRPKISTLVTDKQNREKYDSTSSK